MNDLIEYVKLEDAKPYTVYYRVEGKVHRVLTLKVTDSSRVSIHLMEYENHGVNVLYDLFVEVGKMSAILEIFSFRLNKEVVVTSINGKELSDLKE